MLASGDVIQGQKIDLMLCDCTDVQTDMRGVAMELQDCAFPMLSSISMTSDFCEACKTADVCIVLPPSTKGTDCHGNREVDISYSTISQIDFKSLEMAMHPKVISKNDVATVHCRGPMSTASAVANCLRQLYMDSTEEMQNENKLRHEEAEFGCPPDLSVEDILFNHCDHQFGTMSIESKRQLVFVTSRAVKENAVEDENELQSIEISTRVFARL